MDHFRTTLCLNGVRTADHTPLHVVDAQTLSLNGKLISADDIVERALPSRVATAIEASMAAAPAYASSVFFLLGSQVHYGRLGDAVVNYIVRDQAQHRSLLYDRQVAQRSVVTVTPNGSVAYDGDRHASATPLRYEECLLFAYDGGAVACETLRATDAAATVDEVLGTLRVISFAVFKYPSNKSCVLLVGAHVSTAHMAALLLASRRHIFLYVDATLTAQDVEATTEEMQQVCHSLCAFGLPLDEDVRVARAAVAAAGAADSQTSLHSQLPASRVLDALAHSSEEYELLRLVVALEGNAERGTAQDRRAAQVARAAQAKLQKELEQARAAQQAAETDLAEQRQAHRNELLSLREELQRAQREERAAKQSMSADSEPLTDGRRVSQNLLHSFQQQSQSYLHATMTDATADAATVAQLQHALQEALKAQKFAEEKVRLLELRGSMLGGGPGSTTTVSEPAANGSVVSPRPSLRLPSASGLAPSNNPVTSAAAASPPSWEQSLLQQENTALVAEFQRKEKEWQQRLRHASQEVAQLRREKAAMEATLQLQSQTIAAAQQALVNSRVVQEQEMSQVLCRVRTLSQESRSRHRSHATSVTCVSGGGGGDGETSDSGLATLAVHDDSSRKTPPPLSQPFASVPLSATAPRNGGVMSPKR